MKQNYRNPMKTLLASIAFLLVGGGFSNAQVTFNFVGGSTSTVNANESADKAFDGNTGTKWCANGSENESEAYLTLEASELTYIKGFTMTTANDNANNAGRTPKEYYIKGSVDGNDWEVIYYQADDNFIEDVNYKTYTVYCNCTKKYKYFKLWVKDSNINGGRLFQISEFSLIPGTVGFTKNEGSADAIDGQTSVKWQGNPTQTLILESTEEGGAYITGYQFTTGNDNESWKGRNPKNWKIYGSNDKTSWTLLQEEDNNVTMGDLNYYPYVFQLLSTDVRYKYVKIEVTSTIGGGYFQLSEVAVLGTTEDHVWAEAGECASLGAKIYECSECGGMKAEPYATESHSYEGGICTYCSKADASYMTATDGVYAIGNAAQLKWFAAFVNDVNDDNTAANAKLTADIDMNFDVWTPIGKNSSTMFAGTFDGNNHTIKKLNMKTGESYIGLFGYVTDGATIKNLWIDKTCAFVGTSKVGGIAGMADGGGTVTLLNVVNAASVTSTGNSSANAGGFIGCCITETKVNATNCINAGSVKGQNGECAAFTGWSQSGSTYTDCANIATINNMESNKNLYRNVATLVNCYDASETANKTQGTAKASTTAASGELCFLLNRLLSGGSSFYQTVGSGYPVPFGTQRVYATGTFDCYGTPGEDASFSNSACYPTFSIGAKEELAWFPLYVNAGGNKAGAKLTADIDMDGVSFTPIGTDATPFNATFDGQGHRIMNISNNKGVFGCVSGASTDTWIMNLIIDSSCSFESTSTVAALVAETKGSGAVIHIHNIVNEAKVSTSGQNASALIGNNSDNSQFDIQNCVNTGDITSTNGSHYAGVVNAWMGTNGNNLVKNIINLGTITGYNGTNRMGRFWGTRTNMIDPNAASGEQGYVEGLNASDAATGKIAYLANTAAGEVVFYQTIGTDEYPSPLNEGTVYKPVTSGANSYYANSTSDFTLASMTLTDAADYAADGNFTATSLTYDRTLAAGGYHSLCLPFAITTAMLGSGSKLFTLSAVGTDAVTLTERSSVAAGTPCFASVTSDFTFGTMSNVAMVKDVDNSGTVKGTFTNNDALGAGFYKLSSDGTYFGLTTDGATATAFRSYIAAPAGVKTLNILLSDGTTAVHSPQSTVHSEIYDLAGRRVEKATKGLYIINGKKVVK